VSKKGLAEAKAALEKVKKAPISKKGTRSPEEDPPRGSG
jgi:hypothetical protein